MWAFIMWIKKWWKHTKTAWQCISRLKLRATCKMPLTLEMFELPGCASHIIFRRLHHSWANHEPSHEMICLHSSSPISHWTHYIWFHKNTGKWLKNYNQIWHGVNAKKQNWKSQIYTRMYKVIKSRQRKEKINKIKH